MTVPEVWFQTVLETSLRASPIIVALLVARWVGRGRIRPQVSVLLWVLVVVRLVVPGGLSVSWNPIQPVTPDLFIENMSWTLGLGDDVGFGDAPRMSGMAQPASESREDGVRGGSSAPAAWLLPSGLWLLGAVALLVTQGLAHFFELRRVGRLSETCPDSLRAIVGEEARVAGLGRPVDCLVSDGVRSPSVLGVFRPRLVFPKSLVPVLADEDWRMIVRHEIGHVRRRDLWLVAAFSVGRALHWFNPLVWVAASRCREDCELACDAHVLRGGSPDDRVNYGAMLLKVAGARGRTVRLAVALGINGRGRQLKRRIIMIRQLRDGGSWGRVAAFAVILGCAAVSFTQRSAADGTVTSTGPGATDKAPQGWWKNGRLKECYVVGVDTAVARSKPASAYVKSISAVGEGGFGGMMQQIMADDFRGKRVKFSGWIKTSAAIGGAHLWMRIDGRERSGLRFDNMDGREIKGDSEWRYCEVVLDVPEEATGIFYGFFIAKTGQAWVDDASFEVVSAEVPATTTKPAVHIPRQPVNLGFES